MQPEEVQDNLDRAVAQRKEDQARLESNLTNDIKDLKEDILVIHKKTDQNCKDIASGFGKNKIDHEELLQKVNKLAPLADLADEKTVRYLKEGVELKRSTDNVMNSWKGKAKTIAIFLGVIAVLLTIANAIRDIIMSGFIKIK